MKRFHAIQILVVALAVAIAGAAWAAPPDAQKGKPPGLLKIQALRGADMAKHLNQDVETDGFYYDGSIPMVVDDINRTLADVLMPRDVYVPIVGPRPPGLKNGDRIKLRGKLAKPTPADGKHLEKEDAVLKLAAPDAISVMQASTLAYQPAIAQITLAAAVATFPQYYAVLIAGGYNEANNHVRYWNDLARMYQILRSAGYPPANIYVLYANGTSRNPSVLPVNYAANRANISTVFNLLAGKMKASDTLYIMLNDHGGGYLTRTIGSHGPGNYSGVSDTNGDEPAENPKIDETLALWYEIITDDQFAFEVNKIANYDKMIIQMKQCFSGGFIKDLTKPKRTIMSSSTEYEFSWAHSDGLYGEFTFHYFAALTGAAGADANHDGKISILEAYNYARSHDVAPETPFFEDNGAPPARSGPIPMPPAAGSDGARSHTIFLK